MAFQVRKLLGALEKRAPGHLPFWLYLQNSQISKVLKDFRSKLSQHVVRQIPDKFEIENYGKNVKKRNMSKILREI